MKQIVSDKIDELGIDIIVGKEEFIQAVIKVLPLSKEAGLTLEELIMVLYDEYKLNFAKVMSRRLLLGQFNENEEPPKGLLNNN